MANQINIAVGADIKNLTTGLTAATDQMKQAGAQMESVGASVTQKTEANFKNLQQAYRTTAKDAQTLAMTLGTDSDAFKQAAARAAGFRDQLDDVQDAINAFHPEKKFKVAGDAIAATANVAQGFVGVLHIVGVESVNAEKAISTMLALNGVAQAAQSIEALKGAFIALGTSMQLALGAVALLGAAFLVYNSYAQEMEEHNIRLAESHKKLIDSENRVTSIVQETQNLRVKAMKEGTAKRIAEAELEYKSALDKLVAAHQNEEIADETYRQRKSYLWQIYQNKLADISEKTTDKIKQGEAKRYEVPQQIELGSKLSSGGDLNMMAADAVGANVQDKLNKGWENINASNLKGMDAFKSSFVDLKISAKEQLDKTLQDMIDFKDVAAGVLSQASASLGAAIVSGDFEKGGEQLIKMLGGIAIQIGAAMLAIGVPMALGEPFFGGKSLKLIAGGIALGVVGGAMQASGKAGSGGGGGGGNMGGGGSVSSSTFAPSFGGSNASQYLMLDSRVRGTDIVISADNQRRNNRRVR